MLTLSVPQVSVNIGTGSIFAPVALRVLMKSDLEDTSVTLDFIWIMYEFIESALWDISAICLYEIVDFDLSLAEKDPFCDSVTFIYEGMHILCPD